MNPGHVSHVGLCVDDLEGSKRFYEEAFGFVHEADLDLTGDARSTHHLAVGDPLELVVSYLRLGPFLLELLCYGSGNRGSRSRGGVNDPGLSHITINVDDVGATLDRVRRSGGRVHESTRIDTAVWVEDPEGQRIQVVGPDSRLPALLAEARGRTPGAASAPTPPATPPAPAPTG